MLINAVRNPRRNGVPTRVIALTGICGCYPQSLDQPGFVSTHLYKKQQEPITAQGISG